MSPPQPSEDPILTGVKTLTASAAHGKEVARDEDHRALCRAVHEGRRQGRVIHEDDHPPTSFSYRQQANEKTSAGGQGPQRGNNEEEE